MRFLIYILWILLLLPGGINGQTFIKIKEVPEASFRGISVAKDGSCWISGSKGTIGIAGKNKLVWRFTTIKDFDQFDFRDIYAFDSLHAVAMSAGIPARFLYTEDGGKNWSLAFSDNRSQVFFDAMDFADSLKGFAFSDPVGGKLILAETKSGGRNWKTLAPQLCPAVLDSEAGFAASGSTLQCVNGGYIYIATGGKKAHLFKSSNGGKNWTRFETPIHSGDPSSGIFSLYFSSPSHGMIAGGNYMSDSLSVNNLYITRDGGQTWSKPQNPPHGYLSCVKQIQDKNWICCGTQGVYLTSDDGKNWKRISEMSFHSMAIGNDRKTVFCTGASGKLYILKLL
jgi:photosystem II stability/assembly factor-like uncharacterized protein